MAPFREIYRAWPLFAQYHATSAPDGVRDTRSHLCADAEPVAGGCRAHAVEPFWDTKSEAITVYKYSALGVAFDVRIALSSMLVNESADGHDGVAVLASRLNNDKALGAGKS